jgi:hypothetical protein
LARPRPEICIGVDSFHTSDHLAAAAVKGFAAHGLDVAVNRPYSEALVPARWYQSDAWVSAVLCEINRRLYVDETTAEKMATFAEMMAIVRSVSTALIDLQKTSQQLWLATTWLQNIEVAVFNSVLAQKQPLGTDRIINRTTALRPMYRQPA